MTHQEVKKHCTVCGKERIFIVGETLSCSKGQITIRITCSYCGARTTYTTFIENVPRESVRGSG